MERIQSRESPSQVNRLIKTISSKSKEMKFALTKIEDMEPPQERSFQDTQRGVLSLLGRNDMTIFQILSLLDKDIDTVSRVLDSLKRKRFITCDNGVIGLSKENLQPTDEPIQTAQGPPESPRENPIENAIGNSIERSIGSSIEGPSLKSPTDDCILEKFRNLMSLRPEPITEFDQGYVTPESVKLRIDLLADKGDLDNSHVLLLGDDDLTSIYLFLTKKPKRITVLDIDTRLLHFIQKTRNRLMSEGKDWPILETQRYDVRENLPGAFIGQYTSVITDPLETINGFGLFLRRTAEALKGSGSTALMCLTDLESPPEKWRAFQVMMLKAGLIIKDLIANCQRYSLPDDSFVFNEYPLLKDFRCKEKPLENWYHSNLLRLCVAAGPYPQAISVGDYGKIYG